MVTFRPITFTPAGRPAQTRYLPAGATQRPISYIPPEREPIEQSTRPAGLSRPEGTTTLTPDVIEARSQHVVNTRSAPYSHYIVMGGSWYGVRTVDGMETKERLNPANANTYPNPDYRHQTAGRGAPIFPEGSAGRSEIASSERPQAPGPGSSKAAITAYGEVLASWEREQMWRGVDPSMSYGDIQSSWDAIKFDVPTQERRAYDIRQSQLPTGTSERYTAITRAYQQQKGTILSSSGNLTPTATGYKYATGEAFIPTGPTIQAPPGATLGAMPSAELPGSKVGLIGMIARQKLGMDYITGGSIIPQARQAPGIAQGATLPGPKTGTLEQNMQGYITAPLALATFSALKGMDAFFEGLEASADTFLPAAAPVSHLAVGFGRLFPESIVSLGLLPAAGEFALREPARFAGSIVPGVTMLGEGLYQQAIEDPWETAGMGLAIVTGPKLFSKGYTAARSRVIEANIWRQVPGEHRPTVRATSTIGRYIKGIESPVQKEPRFADILNIKERAAPHIRAVLGTEEHSVFGTTTILGQMEHPYRITKDIDVIAGNPRRLQTKLFAGMKDGYRKAGSGIDVIISGKKTAHALDIHAPPADYPVKPASSLHITYAEPEASYPFDYTPKKLLKTGPIQQEHLYTQVQRKATATLGAPEKGGGWRFGPEAHRMKDIYDLVETASYLTAAEKARTSPWVNPIRRYKVWRLERAIGTLREDPMVSGVLEEFAGEFGITTRTTGAGVLQPYSDVGISPSGRGYQDIRTAYASQARKYGRSGARINIEEMRAPAEDVTIRISPSPSVRKGIGDLIERVGWNLPKSYIPSSASYGLDAVIPSYFSPTRRPARGYTPAGGYPALGGPSGYPGVPDITDLSYYPGFKPERGYTIPGTRQDYTFPKPGYTFLNVPPGPYGYTETTVEEYHIPATVKRYKQPARRYQYEQGGRREYGYTPGVRTYKYQPPTVPTPRITGSKTTKGRITGGLTRFIPWKVPSLYTWTIPHRTQWIVEEKPKKKRGIRLAPDVLASAWNIESPVPRIRQAFGYNIGMPLAKSQRRNELAISNIQKSRIPTRYVWKMPFEQIRRINVPKVI